MHSVGAVDEFSLKLVTGLCIVVATLLVRLGMQVV